MSEEKPFSFWSDFWKVWFIILMGLVLSGLIFGCTGGLYLLGKSNGYELRHSEEKADWGR